MKNRVEQTSMVDRLRSVHQRACNILNALHQLTRKLSSSSTECPLGENWRWAEVHNCFVSLKTARNGLGCYPSLLTLFQGLRPDTVQLCGRECANWHHGVLRIGDIICQSLRIRAGIASNVRGDYLWDPEEGDWLREDLGLPVGGDWHDRCRFREVFWQRAIEAFNSGNTLQKSDDTGTFDFDTRGWATLRQLDFRWLPVRLTNELQYAISCYGCALPQATTPQMHLPVQIRCAEKCQPPSITPDLPVEISARQAAELLNESLDVVLTRLKQGQLSYRDVAAPGSSRPRYRILRADVIRLRTTYTTASVAAELSCESQPRRRPRGPAKKKLKHIALDEND